MDGYHIALLIMALCEVLCPELLRENRLYWLRAPLYIVTTNKKKHYFYSSEELQKSGIIGDVVYVKGLGELAEEDLVNSMFSPENQLLEPITYNQEGLDLLIRLMGSDSIPKRDFIFNEIDFTKIIFE